MTSGLPRPGARAPLRILGSRRSAPRRARTSDGAVTIEFALILMPLLVLLFGVIQFSLWFFSAQSGSAAAREAVRRSAVGDLSCSQLSASAADDTQLDTAGFTATRRYYDASYTTVSSTTPTKAANQVAVGDNVRVEVSYLTVDMHFPMIPVPSSNGVRGQITETAVGRVEYVTANTVPCP